MPPGATADAAASGRQGAESRLVQLLERGWSESARAAGEWLACRPGCSECCHGPFPISRLDARWLRAGLARLRRLGPERAAGIDRRARRAMALLRDDFPGDPSSGRLVDDEARLDGFFERHAGLACPVLDPATRCCELYDARPVACRVYGPPLLYGSEKAAPCRLCFKGAPTEVVERCRWEPDPGDLEETILARFGVAAGQEWETLIAHALAGPACDDDGEDAPAC